MAGVRILSTHAHKYLKRNVTVVGEVTSINTSANTLTLSMPDGESMIALLPRDNSTTIDKNLLTEVTGTLISKGQIEVSWVKQYGHRESALFNRTLYVEAMNILDAHRSHYDVGMV